jgi:hypothetical protein
MLGHRRDLTARSSRLTPWLVAAVAVVSVVVLVSWLVIALAHVDDEYHVNWVTGTWLALARHVNEGVLYPPLFDGSSFGGTRYMPVQFTLEAGLARLTGDYLVSSKLFGYASGALLYCLAFFVYRRMSRSGWLAAGLVSAVVSSGPGLEAATTFRGDALPAALQLAAITVAARRSRSMAALAGVLCAFAFASKLSAIWAAVAILIWLATADRSRLRIFAGSLLASNAVMLAIFEVASKGRLTTNVFNLAAAGQGGTFSLEAFAEKLVDSGQGSGATWILVPFVVTSVAAAFGARRVTIYHVAFLVACVVVVVVMTDAGTVLNHFLDLQILAGALVAHLWRAVTPTAMDLVRISILSAILVGTLASYVSDVLNDTRIAAKSLVGRGDESQSIYPKDLIHPDDRLLSEDPYIPVSLGQDPVVLDAFMLRRILRDHPDWEAKLVHAIDTHKFTKVVLVRQLDTSDSFWQTNDFGLPTVRAIARNYRLVDVPSYYRRSGHLWIYAPSQELR